MNNHVLNPFSFSHPFAILVDHLFDLRGLNFVPLKTAGALMKAIRNAHIGDFLASFYGPKKINVGVFPIVYRLLAYVKEIGQIHVCCAQKA